MAPTRKSKGDHIRRPMNSFMLYKAARLSRLRANNTPPTNMKTFTSETSKLWRAEPQHIKDSWAANALAVSAKHAADNPGYRFAPKPTRAPRPPPKKAKQEGGGSGRPTEGTRAAAVPPPPPPDAPPVLEFNMAPPQRSNEWQSLPLSPGPLGDPFMGMPPCFPQEDLLHTEFPGVDRLQESWRSQPSDVLERWAGPSEPWLPQPSGVYESEVGPYEPWLPQPFDVYGWQAGPSGQ